MASSRDLGGPPPTLPDRYGLSQFESQENLVNTSFSISACILHHTPVKFIFLRLPPAAAAGCISGVKIMLMSCFSCLKPKSHQAHDFCFNTTIAFMPTVTTGRTLH